MKRLADVIVHALAVVGLSALLLLGAKCAKASHVSQESLEDDLVIESEITFYA